MKAVHGSTSAINTRIPKVPSVVELLACPLWLDLARRYPVVAPSPWLWETPHNARCLLALSEHIAGQIDTEILDCEAEFLGCAAEFLGCAAASS